MIRIRRNTMLAAALLAGGMAAGTLLPAVADERYPPVTDAMTKKECGDCHMAFQPAFLPARSWAKIMDNLSDHFGEDASLPKEKVEHIKAYLMANAADKRWRSKMMRGVRKNWTPLRITELPYWRHEHEEEVRPSAWKDPRVKSKANCKACHKRADRGIYDDEEYEYGFKYGGYGEKYEKRRRYRDDDDDYKKYRRKYRDDDDDYKYGRRYRDDD